MRPVLRRRTLPDNTCLCTSAETFNSRIGKQKLNSTKFQPLIHAGFSKILELLLFEREHRRWSQTVQSVRGASLPSVARSQPTLDRYAYSTRVSDGEAK